MRKGFITIGGFESKGVRYSREMARFVGGLFGIYDIPSASLKKFKCNDVEQKFKHIRREFELESNEEK